MMHFSEQAREEFRLFTEALVLVHPNHQQVMVGNFITLPTYNQCTDILPEHNCRLLNIPLSSTYGQAAKAIAQEYGLIVRSPESKRLNDLVAVVQELDEAGQLKVLEYARSLVASEGGRNYEE